MILADRIKNMRLDDFLSYSDFCDIRSNHPNNFKFHERNEQEFLRYLQNNPKSVIRKVRDSNGKYIEGVCAWHTSPDKIDKALISLQKVSLNEVTVISLDDFYDGHFANPKRMLDKDYYKKQIQSQVEKHGCEFLLNSLPPLYGYIYKNTIVLLDGNRRISAFREISAPYMYCWLEEINDYGECLNMHYYSNLVGNQDLTNVVKEYYNLPNCRPVPDYRSVRRYFYPNLSDQVGALVESIATGSTDKIIKISKIVTDVKLRVPKE